MSIQDLHVYYGSSHVLQGVNLQIMPGGVTAIVGRNGVGKTTLVNAVMGLAPATGRVTLAGSEILGQPPAGRRGLGLALVPQGRRVFRSLTVDEHLRLVPSDPGNPFSQEWIFDTFPRLAERRRSLAGTLSGGEQSMLAISRALSANPRLLLMDEPTEGLAPLLVETVRDVIRQVQTRGMTVLLVEQNLGFALEVADTVAVMQRGEIEAVVQRTEIRDVADLSARLLSIAAPGR